jgi:hypothetical protein
MILIPKVSPALTPSEIYDFHSELIEQARLNKQPKLWSILGEEGCPVEMIYAN